MARCAAARDDAATWKPRDAPIARAASTCGARSAPLVSPSDQAGRRRRRRLRPEPCPATNGLGRRRSPTRAATTTCGRICTKIGEPADAARSDPPEAATRPSSTAAESDCRRDEVTIARSMPPARSRAKIAAEMVRAEPWAALGAREPVRNVDGMDIVRDHSPRARVSRADHGQDAYGEAHRGSRIETAGHHVDRAWTRTMPMAISMTNPAARRGRARSRCRPRAGSRRERRTPSRRRRCRRWPRIPEEARREQGAAGPRPAVPAAGRGPRSGPWPAPSRSQAGRRVEIGAAHDAHQPREGVEADQGRRQASRSRTPPV